MELAPGQQELQKFRDGGYTEEEVSQYQAYQTDKFIQGGFSAQDVRDYWGQKDPDMSTTTAHVKQNLATQKPEDGQTKPKLDATQPVSAKNILEAMEAGWQHSFSGLFTRNKMPDIQVDENATTAQTLASTAAGMFGDIPAMAAGIVSGGAAGTAIAGPPGAAIGAVSGAFAVPAAMRKILIDHYQKGDVTDAGDFARRVVGATWEGTKGAIVGAATELSGGMAGALGGTAARMASEVAAQTTVSSALEGHLPNKQDFINGAVAIGGLHAVGFGVGKSGYVADKLMNIYSETGAKPVDVLEAANNDPTLKGELLSQNPELPKEATPANPDIGKIEVPSTEEQEKLGLKPAADPDQKDILSRIAQEPKVSAKAPLADRVRDGFDQAYVKYFDRSAAIKDAIKDIEDLPAEENPHVLFRLHAAIENKVQEALEVGTRDSVVEGDFNGEGFVPIVKDIQRLGPDGLDNFKAYGIAANSLELAKREIDQPGDRAVDQRFVDSHPEMKPLLDRYNEFRNRNLDLLADSGRYSQDFIDALKKKEAYFPMKKVLEPDPVTGKTPSSTRDLKKIGSSDLQLTDPIMQTYKDVNNMIRMAHENITKRAFVEPLMAVNSADNPFIKLADEQSGMPGKDQIESYVDGKREIHDLKPGLADVLKSFSGNQPALDAWVGLLKPYAKAQRLMTVDNPFFAPNHMWRQQLTAPTLSQTGLKLFQALLYAPKYLMEKASSGKSYQDFISDGGAQQSVLPMDKWLDGKIQALDKDAPFINKAWNNVKTVGQFSHLAITLHDNIIRFAEYERMLGKGASRTKAAFAAREVLPDFQKAGLQNSAVLATTPFLRVHLLGQARSAQELSSNPYGYIAKNLAAITVPSLLLSAAQAGDDATNDLPEYQKYGYWNVHVSHWRPANSLAEAMSVKSAYPSNYREMPDGTHQVNDGPIMRMQKPFTNGVFFGSAVEATMKAFKDKDPKAFEDFVKTVGGSVMAEPIPALAKPMIEQMVNRNLYSGQQIVRQSMQDKVAEMQYDRYTSETAKAIAGWVHKVPILRDFGPKDAKLDSPSVIENYIHSLGTGSYFVEDVIDKALRKAGVAPDDVRAARTWADVPGVNAFLDRFPTDKSQSIQDFEDNFDKANKAYSSIRSLMKEGDFQGAQKLQSEYGGDLQNRIQGIMAEIRGTQSKIVKLDALPPPPGTDLDSWKVQKRQLMDMMTLKMVTDAKMGNTIIEQNAKAKKAAGI